MDDLHGDGLDANCVNAELMLRVSPGNEFRVDGFVDNRLIGEIAFHSTAPPSSRSSFLGKARGLSLPSRMDTLPEWDVVEFSVHALHFPGVGKEKAKRLLRSALMERSFSWNPLRFSFTEVVEMTCPSPAYVRTRSLTDLPTE